MTNDPTHAQIDAAQREASERLEGLRQAYLELTQSADEAKQAYYDALDACRKERPWEVPGLSDANVEILSKVGGWRDDVMQQHEEQQTP